MSTVLAIVALLVSATDVRIKDAEGFAAHGETDTARATYAQIFDELAHSGASASASLHYNVGTLALGAGDVGPAVLHLLAAERRDPLDDDIRHNLAAALARRADQVEGNTSLPVGARLPPTPVGIAFGVCLAVLGILLGVAGIRRQGLPNSVVWGAIVAGVVSGAVFAVRFAAESVAVVVVQTDTEARPQPDATAAGFTVHPGLTGTVVSEQQGFTRLRLENGVDVWVDTAAVAAVP